MASKPTLLDQWGRPIERRVLVDEVAGPSTTGVRSPLTGYPADGLNPRRLASILRDADAGDPVRYLELAETIEERDPHYLGVLGTRRRSVSQIDITVKAASDSPRDQEIAEMVREWLDRDELTDEIFNILDCIGKGFSLTEIIWDTSEGQWRPERLERRDPRWFRFDRNDLTTPVMLDETGREVPLPGGKFVYANIQAKSGLPLRSGLARVASWGWMFKAYTQRDWAIFTQTYGQPVRLGKYGPGASKADKDTLYRAVANIAGDCAGIIPDSMSIDFVEAKSIGASTDHYERRADWLDRQISKAVLGQTATTDAVTGGLGSGKEHREVQEDIERADAKALSAVLNRDLVRVWVDLEFGPQEKYPRLIIARPEEEDLAAFSSGLSPLLSAGLRVRAKEVREKFGLSDPEADDEVLGGKMASVPSQAPVQPAPGDEKARNSAIEYPFNTRLAPQRPETPAGKEGASAALSAAPSPEDAQADQLALEAAPAMSAIFDRIEVMLESASDFDEFRTLLHAGFPDLDTRTLAQVMGTAFAAANAAGRVATAEDSDG